MLLYVSTYIYAGTYTDYDKLTNNSGGGNIVATMIDDNPYDWEISATPINGYKFGYWNDFYGTIESFENPIRFTIDRENRNYGLQAVFVKDDAFIGGWLADSIIVRSLSTYISDSDMGKAVLYVDEGELEENIATPVRLDHGIWRFYANDLFEDNKNAGKNLHIVLLNECDEPTSVINTVVPYIVNTECNADTISFASARDVEVLSDGILNINANTTINGFLDIHEGAKVVVEEGKNLTVNGIIMRGNGITKEWPQLVVQGHINNNNENTIYYDYTLDQHAYYPLAFPYNVTCSEVYHLISKKKTGYQAFTFDTDARADGGNGWVMFDDTVEPIFEAGKGYIIYASPTKWNGNRQQSAVIRFPMEADLHETAEANVNKSTPTTYTTPDPASRQDMEVLNWNLIGNPYLANFKVGSNTADTNKIVQGYLEWNEEEGKYDLIRPGSDEKAALRYITYSNDGYRSYEQQRIRDFVLKPFNSYFVQTSAGDGIMFSKDDFAATPAPRRTQGNDVIEELETGILLTQGNRTEQIGLLFGDYTYDYELNADLLKEIGEAQPMSAYSLQGSTPLAFQALPAEAMARPILLGYRKAQSGLMTFSFDDSQYDRNLLDGLWLTDIFTGQVTNLLVEDYTFTPESAQDDNRFYLSCERRKVVDVTTNAEETTQQRTIIRVFDMFGREMHGDVNALPQGVYILMDNLGNTSKEILGQ